MFTQDDLLRKISDKVEESLTLEYKAAEALEKTPGKKSEITKDVSAMANSDGGIIIYGIAESEHLPERITPISRVIYPKEWVEDVITNIRPRIDGVIVEPIQLLSGPNDVAYAIIVPKSNTAHQALDKRYYKRFNFKAEPMDDYEIRDIMGRGNKPRVEVHCSLMFKTESYTLRDTFGISYQPQETRIEKSVTLNVSVKNVSGVVIKYLSGFINLPSELLAEKEIEDEYEEDGVLLSHISKDNTVRDVVGGNSVGGNFYPKYGSSWFYPLLPALNRTWRIKLDPYFSVEAHADKIVKVLVAADNADPYSLEVVIREMPISTSEEIE